METETNVHIDENQIVNSFLREIAASFLMVNFNITLSPTAVK
jgi:hypothetical protein